MKAPEIIARFRRQFVDLPLAEKQAMLAAHVLLEVLADAADFAQLANGCRLRDGLDFTSWMRELEAEAARVITKPVTNVKHCPTCGHTHASGEECEVDMGGAGKCGCRAEVHA